MSPRPIFALSIQPTEKVREACIAVHHTLEGQDVTTAEALSTVFLVALSIISTMEPQDAATMTDMQFGRLCATVLSESGIHAQPLGPLAPDAGGKH